MMNVEASRETIHKMIDELSEQELHAALVYLERLKLGPHERALRDERDVGIINAHADELSVEMDDILGYQAEW